MNTTRRKRIRANGSSRLRYYRYNADANLSVIIIYGSICRVDTRKRMYTRGRRCNRRSR